MGTLTIFEYSFKMSLSSLQLVGNIFFEASLLPFFQYFFYTTSREGLRPLFFEPSSFFSDFFSSRGSERLILSSLSSKNKYPQTPSCSTQATIFFISGSPILERYSLYLDLSPSTVRLIFLFSTIYSKLLLVMVLQADNSSNSSRSSWRRQLGLLPETSTGGLEASTFTKNQWQVMDAVFLIRVVSAWMRLDALFLEMRSLRVFTIWERDLVRCSISMVSDIVSQNQ